ncbi:uncharacterized protein LOC111382106 [Olea europaea var. sylvestris]|uniref:uncharacterized protein LOC111382106 n=1 Tax=Olea europaea var. sylvestris TaxID=158386 RepID=UPI000C1D8019|nr:uncharacterized protein LOC111382106 [Olea europaea var. sylvestris]
MWSPHPYCNFDIDGDRRPLCPYSAVRDDIEADDFQAGNLDLDNSMDYLQIPLTEDDNPNDSGIGEKTKIIEPTVGMKFKDENEVFEFYKHYAYQIGFPVRKRNSKKGDDRVVRYVTLTCNREGRRTSGTTTVLKPQATMQTGCKVRLIACSELTGDGLEINDIAGIPLHKSFNSAVVEASGYDKIACIEEDCRNFIDKVRRLKLGEGDAVAIQAYFSKDASD